MLKFLTAGLITALVVGGVVYVGLDDATVDSLRTQANVTVEDVSEDRDIARPDTDIYDLDRLLEEADRLSIPDMRSDAYLSLIDVAVAQGDFDFATGLVEELDAPELRDTARQRIAIGLARDGQLDAAFEQVDALDIEALRDPIRLEIIRSLDSGRR